MARIGTSAAHIVLAIFAVAMFVVSGTMAQDIAPSPAMATGAGSALPVSAVFLCSSMLVSLIALLERGIGDIEIQLEATKGDLNRATRVTLVGKIHVNKTLNRRGLKGFYRASGQGQNKNRNVKLIGSSLGKLIKVDDKVWERGWSRSYLRVRIEIDLKKPLVSGFWVIREGKDKVWAEIKYEKIVDFCFGCGRMGHLVRTCRFEKLKSGDEGQVRRYGGWMKSVRGRNNIVLGIKEGNGIGLGKNCGE
ncbi:hypothetical protein Gotur_033040 [Gossypium turneri]